MARINVTKTFLPPREMYEEYIKKIWESSYLTNQGPLLKDLEKNIEEYLDVDNFHFVANGTLALQLALNSLDIHEGEVITTPFSYVATTSSILWERCTPVFVDIEPETFCIDANKIEAAITNMTKAIMPVHVFGQPCDIDKIELIAKKYKLKVIYDASHAFGVQYKDKSLFDFGDISTCSFHATKLFHTIEGGGLFVKDVEISNKTELIKRFGHNGDDHRILGINAKASEFQAAMGLCNLKFLEENIKKRRSIYELYNRLLDSKLQKPKIRDNTIYNYSYYPVVFNTEEETLNVIDSLSKKDIYPRRYFYPSLNTLKYLGNFYPCPISEDISKRILCLPLYGDLEEEKVKLICEIINQ